MTCEKAPALPGVLHRGPAPTLHLGDCLDVLSTLDAESIDAIVCDPPYGLGFMGKAWDALPPGVDVFRECLRVLKPGGHLIAFGGTRTYHRLACAVEDAGFEIRDSIAWVYGTGFPKSLDVSKAIDKAMGHWRGRAGAVLSNNGSMSAPNYERTPKGAPITAPAKQWQGWGTALKPAHEPAVLARKPLIGTVAANVLEHGTGGLNIDGCRVGNESRYNLAAANKSGGVAFHMSASGMPKADGRACTGRFPSNLIHDGSDAVLEVFPEAGGGSTARFFYCAKASKRDRTEAGRVDNRHPTVKPTSLMRYLVRLVTPPGGVVLDPFMGSGSTGKAAVLEGFGFVGIERDADSFETAKARIEIARGDL